MFSVSKCVSVLVALVCLSAPSISRSWGGYERGDDFEQPHHGWGPDFDSGEEDSWGSKQDYGNFGGNGYEHHKFEHFGYPHNNEGHKFDHQNHEEYGYHQHKELHHQGHFNHNDNRHDYHQHPSRPESVVPSSYGLPQNNNANAHNVRPTVQNTGYTTAPALPDDSQNVEQYVRSTERLVFPDPNSIPPFSRTTSAPQVPSSSSAPQAPALSPAVTPTVSPAVTQRSTTISSLVLQEIVTCIRDCPNTPEFNPVCGTNNVTYNNLGLMECHKNCGVNVALGRRSPCPQPLPPAPFISVPMLSTEVPIINARLRGTNSSAPIKGKSAPAESTQTTTLPPITSNPTLFTKV